MNPVYKIISAFAASACAMFARAVYAQTAETPAVTSISLSDFPVGEHAPFFTSLGADFDEPFNRMWRIYGSVAPGEGAVIRFGSEPAYFEWMARKLAWTDEWEYRQGLVERLQEMPISPDGYAWSWRTRPDWPTEPGALHQENNAKFILAVCRYYLWSQDERFLELASTNTTKSVSALDWEDVSKGMTLLEKVRLAMTYQLEVLNGKDGLLVIDNNHNTGLPDGAPTNYWDNFPFGYKDAYSNIYFHASLLALADVEDRLQNQARATELRDLAAGVRRRFTETFWDPRLGRFIGCIDVNGGVWDLGFTFLNTEAIVYGLADAEQVRNIYDWLDGRRIVESDTSQGPDIYRFRWAPRATTLDVASLGTPYWWKSIGNRITAGPGGNATFGEHLENGGAIFYTTHYDLLARAKWLGADNAWDRLRVIMEEFGVDELRRNPPNNMGRQWKFGIIGVFPESGLVPASFLYAFLGLDAGKAGLIVQPNLPSALEYAGIRNLAFANGLYTLTVYPDRVMIRCGKSSEPPLHGVVKNLPPGADYSRVVVNVATGEEQSRALTKVNADGYVPFSVSLAQGQALVIQPAYSPDSSSIRP